MNPSPHAAKIDLLFGAVEMNHEALTNAVGDAPSRLIRYEAESFAVSLHFIQHIPPCTAATETAHSGKRTIWSEA